MIYLYITLHCSCKCNRLPRVSNFNAPINVMPYSPHPGIHGNYTPHISHVKVHAKDPWPTAISYFCSLKVKFFLWFICMYVCESLHVNIHFRSQQLLLYSLKCLWHTSFTKSFKLGFEEKFILPAVVFRVNYSLIFSQENLLTKYVKF